MMLLRHDPLRELEQLTHQLWASELPTWSLPMDAWREGDHFVARLDLPGVDPESIDVSVDGNVLTVKAERSWSPAEGDTVSARERFHGRFVRRLGLGKALDRANVEAHYDQGVLTLTIPVARDAESRRVPVQVGGASEAPPIESSATSAHGTAEAA
jgi:HSP20 family protein